MMPPNDIVDLDAIDGFEFEVLCERIFRKSNWGAVERIGGVADGGRDLIIHTPEGQIIIECKHQPSTTIGRPIIQKLHSVVVSSGAVRGIVVTTGRFSSEAVEHANLLSQKIPIDLFDRNQLINLAEKSGITLRMGSKNSTIFSFPAYDVTGIKDLLCNELRHIHSHPMTVSELIRVKSDNLLLEAHYVIRAGIEQDFSTSVGLIHSMRKSDLYLIINASDGSILPDEDVEFLRNSSLIPTSQIPVIGSDDERTPFGLGSTPLKKIAIEHLCKRYTVNVSYWGRNNRKYTKTCVPGPKSIRIVDTKQVLLPRYSLDLFFLEKKYPCSAITNDERIKFKSATLNQCKICLKNVVLERTLLCNACGNLAHRPKFFGSHSHTCRNCKKTVCKNCTYWSRRFLLFKRILCEACADLKPESKRRLAE